MQKLRFHIVTNPWEKTDYLVLLHTPVTNARPGVSSTYMRIVGINQQGEHKQFDIPLKKWQLAQQRAITLIETEAPSVEIATPVTGSRLEDPWKVGFTYIEDTVIAYAEQVGDHFIVQGIHKSNTEKKFAVKEGVFRAACLKPRVFVQIESDYAPTNLIPDLISA